MLRFLCEAIKEEVVIHLENSGIYSGNLENSGIYSGKKYITKDRYVLREIAGESILVSVGDGVADFCGIVKLNASAKVIWNTLRNGAGKEELVQALVDAFSISEEKAKEDVEKSLELLIQREMISCE